MPNSLSENTQHPVPSNVIEIDCPPCSTQAPSDDSTQLSKARVEALSLRLGADPRELIPCRAGTKIPLVRGFNLPGYSTNWPRLHHNGLRQANIALLLGSHSRFIGLDCDTPAAVERVRDLVPNMRHVTTARGILLLAISDRELAGITSSTYLKMTLDGEAAGELRLQSVYSVVDGRHPTRVRYSLEASAPAPVVNLGDFVADLRARGFVMPELQPPVADGERRRRNRRSSDARYWCHQAAAHARFASERDDLTVGTDPFIFYMTTGLRVRPQLADVVVSSFMDEVHARGLTVRGGHERVLHELQGRLKGWTNSYGRRIVHRSLKEYLDPDLQNPHQDTQNVLVHFLSGMKMKRDFRLRVMQVGGAFVRRAKENVNKRCYESMRALEPTVPAKTFNRITSTLVESGLLIRAENTVASKLPKHRQAKYEFRLSDAATKLLADAENATPAALGPHSAM